MKLGCFVFAAVLSLTACKKEAEAPADPAAVSAALYQRGKVIYLSRCIACHNTDPKVDGALGPANFGASLELLEARLLRAEYPVGYTPKRNTKLMTAMPDTQADIPALHAFLNDLK